MICKPCSVAADLVTYIKETETFRGDLHTYVLAAKQLHKECGNTCDCAHVMPRIKPANRSVKETAPKARTESLRFQRGSEAGCYS